MRIVQTGSGAPLVLVPGIQGRWEYVRAAADALSRTFRVITFPLCDEPGAGARFDPSDGFNSYTAQVLAVMDEAGVDRAVVCGVSFGGLIALRFAAMHPGRTSALVLASTPGPGWRPPKRQRLYSRMPRVLGPLFLIETPRRLRDELAAAFPDRQDRRAFVRSQLRLLVSAPPSLSRMAARARMFPAAGLVELASRVTAPALVVTGERALDRVVPTDTSVEYLRLIRGARLAVLEHTGHVGFMTRPDAFAGVIRDFLAMASHHAA